VVLAAGETVIEDVLFEPFDHEYVLAPFAVMVALPPTQIGFEFMVNAGKLFTNTLATIEPVHVPFVPVTV
jgi:hypothetical protein